MENKNEIINKIDMDTNPRIRHLSKLNFAHANFWFSILTKQRATFKLVKTGCTFDLTIIENVR